MNRLLITIILGGLTFTGFTSCDNDNDLSKDSIFANDTSMVVKNKFDTWIDQNYTANYNIKVLYRYTDIEADHSKDLAPADLEKAEILAKIVKYCWMEAYDEVAGVDFTRQYVPKILQFIGSAAWNNNGTIVLGTAEGGLKVTLYMVNEFTLDKDVLNEYYFKTMHHEFAHILHQTKSYDPAYQKISEGKYVSGDWYMKSDTQALTSGFITPYAMSEPREDIAEMTAMYIVLTPEEWEARLETAGTTGRPIIEQKWEIVHKYMLNSWGIDMDQLRDVVQARMNDVVSGKLDLDSFVNSLK